MSLENCGPTSAPERRLEAKSDTIAIAGPETTLRRVGRQEFGKVVMGAAFVALQSWPTSSSFRLN
jgi:hypothetical protein